MHPLFLAALVFAVVLAVGFLALALVVTEPRTGRRRRPDGPVAVAPWMDLDGSARRRADRRPAAHA